MPSLLNTTVAANYLAMPAQQTYGVANGGKQYANFGTRNLRFLKITLGGGFAATTTLSFTGSTSGTTLTVTAVGTPAAGYNLFPGAALTSGVSACTITQQLTSTETNGQFGGKGTYLISVAQTVASTTIGGTMAFDLSVGSGPYAYDATANTYTDSRSWFAQVIRATQFQAELYFVNAPTATTVVIAVSDDTIDDGTAAASQYTTTYVASLATAIQAAIPSINATASTVTVAAATFA